MNLLNDMILYISLLTDFIWICASLVETLYRIYLGGANALLGPEDTENPKRALENGA